MRKRVKEKIARCTSSTTSQPFMFTTPLRTEATTSETRKFSTVSSPRRSMLNSCLRNSKRVVLSCNPSSRSFNRKPFPPVFLESATGTSTRGAYFGNWLSSRSYHLRNAAARYNGSAPISSIAVRSLR